ncbi:MrcB family domain-containing protein [Nocardia abscessus]|uniref:MrcB family domain-containing protein n=1 Tax=Nocardia abscessus TaxID=120957 RepID=UPI0024564151|nr:DUF3578 domain-containing protein [Nocardia abscessus]
MPQLGELFTEVLALQADVSTDAKSSSMRRRKALVQYEIPEWIRTELAGAAVAGWDAEGSNGKGTPAKVPWSRFFDPERSPKAGKGWYAVYLFSAAGDAVYLSLNQGTSPFNPASQRITSLSDSFLIARAEWARSALAADPLAPGSFEGIDLHTRIGLGHAYELGNVHGVRYSVDAIPTDSELRADFAEMVRLLRRLYELSDLTPFIPGDEPPEITDAELAASETAGNTRRRVGQGFRLNQAEKVAIELRAVELATKYFEADGYKVTYTGAKEPFDLLATRGEETVYVEVKGTTSLGEQVILTYNEVEHHRDVYPDNALVVVHSISLDRSASPVVAAGGTISVNRPWKIDESDLRPISYQYNVTSP